MSGIKILTSTEDFDKNQWNEFVYKHPLGNIYQSPQLYEVYNKTKGFYPIIVVSLKHGKINGVLQAVIISEGRRIVGKFTSRSLIIGGPLAENNDEEIILSLFNAYEKKLSKKAIYTEIREIFELPCQNLLLKLDYQVEKRLNILVDLTKSEEELWNEVHSKRRNDIKRAQKKGVIIKEINAISDIINSYNILKHIYKRAKLPLAEKNLFINCFDDLYEKGFCKFLGAYNQEELIGMMLTLCYKDRVIDWYAGSNKTHYDKNPNDLIPWEAFKISKNDGFKIFDFGGAGKPNVPYGVRDYKKKFGGYFIELNRYQKIHKPFLMTISKLGLAIIQKMS